MDVRGGIAAIGGGVGEGGGGGEEVLEEVEVFSHFKKL
jgi:hypothetical protein